MIAASSFVEFLYRRRWVLLILAAILAIVSWRISLQFSYDRSIENMFAEDDPILVSYLRLKRTFGGNEIILAVYEDPNLFDPSGDGLDRLANLREQLEKLDGVQHVLTIDQPIGRRIIAPDSEAGPIFRDLFAGYTHSTDETMAALVCMMTPETALEVTSDGGDMRREAISDMRDIMHKQPNGRIAGEPVMISDGFRLVEEDGRRLALCSTLLLGATIAFFFHSLRWVVIALAVVHLAQLLTKALLAASGLQMSMVSSMLTAIVTVIGVATVIHIIVQYRAAQAEGLDARSSLLRAGRLLAVPILWTCLTDAVGFLSLTVSKVGPVFDYGVMMAVGSLMVLLAVGLVVPGLAMILPRKLAPRRAWGERLLGRRFETMLAVMRKRPRSMLALATLGTIFCALGIGRLEVESDFTRNFREDSQIVVAYSVIENRFGGAGVWDILLPAPAHPDSRYWKRVRRLEQRLLEIPMPGTEQPFQPALTKALSLADAEQATRVLPLMDHTFLGETSSSARVTVMRTYIPAFVDALRARDPDPPHTPYVRIMLRSSEQQTAEVKRQIIDEVTRIAQQEFPSAQGTTGAEVTGIYVLLTELISSMLRDQWLAFAVAVAGVGLMLLLAFRSPLLAVIALVPNIGPVVIICGLMGWLGLRINMGAAMIAAVSMGLSIDSSIHYLTAFRRARAAGHSTQDSIALVEQSVGHAVVFSTIALVIGFGTLCTSPFVPTVTFGFLVGVTMIGGLIGNLVILPMLLQLFVKTSPHAVKDS